MIARRAKRGEAAIPERDARRLFCARFGNGRAKPRNGSSAGVTAVAGCAAAAVGEREGEDGEQPRLPFRLGPGEEEEQTEEPDSERAPPTLHRAAAPLGMEGKRGRRSRSKSRVPTAIASPALHCSSDGDHVASPALYPRRAWTLSSERTRRAPAGCPAESR